MSLQTSPGVLEVITGPMFSGKSEELIRRLKRARIARQQVACFKPDIDLRYHRNAIASHSSQTHEAIAVASTQDLREVLYPKLKDTDVISGHPHAAPRPKPGTGGCRRRGTVRSTLSGALSSVYG